MPPRRSARASTGSTKSSSVGQNRLSFTSKVTKNTTPSSTKSKLSSSITSHPKITSPLESTITSEAAIAPQAVTETRIQEGGEKTEEEEKAAKITDAQIRKYWKEREGERLSKRVHQEGLGVEEKVLRLFDMSSQFGPAIGISRQKRWSRANKLGLSPPIEVLAVLLKEEEKGNPKIERAYVDELMGAKLIVGGGA